MKTLVVIILLSAIIYLVSDFSGYKNCMSQTKSDYISEKGAKHVAAVLNFLQIIQVLISRSFHHRLPKHEV